MQTSETDIWTLMARSLSGEATTEELESLHMQLQKDELLQQQYEVMRQMWLPASNKNTESNSVVDDRVSKILQQAVVEDVLVKKRKKLPYIKATIAIAALLAIVFFAVGLWSLDGNSNNGRTTTYKVIETVNGSRSRNVLPDGSVVWLNAGSRLKISPKFNTTNRDIFLEGEGYFEVVKSSKPFIVHVHDITLTVLGTAFNVKYFAGDKVIETTLIKGSLKVNRKEEKAIVLQPLEKMVIPAFNLTADSQPLQDALKPEPIEAVAPSAISETAWMYNRLEFRGDDFETLATKLERWYNIKISFTDEASRKIVFNGSFENETAEQAFKALQQVAPFQYKTINNEILISSP